MSSMPAGYSYKMFSGDWTGFDLVLPAIKVGSADECAAQTLSRGGHIFTYFPSPINDCYAKNPVSYPGFTTVLPTSSNSYYALQDFDLNGHFDFTGSGANSGPSIATAAACAQRCVQTSGCLAASFQPGYICNLKKPDPPSPSSPSAQAGVIYVPGSPICTSTTQCSASQCGTKITDNCGKQITCAACPPPPPPSCVSTGAAACSVGTCGLEIFDNCGKKVQCPACPDQPPNPSNSDTASPNTSGNSSSPLQPSVSVSIVVVSGSPVTVAVATVQPTATPNTALIAGIAVGALVVIAGIGAFIYSKKKPLIEASSPSVLATKHSYFEAGEQSSNIHDLPVYAGSDLFSSPEKEARIQITHSVSSVPGFYSATVDYVPVKDGQLHLVKGQRVYVTAVTANGWCKGLISGEDGWVHVDMLGPIG
ncbi:UNVERIFIED_CONTAM: hypothetical protein HDU68_008234 [Siphonaria sp. JEL0065]|nr:hypothetical protein HDU68_008234 [Siphonaria sp. JEL0065]